MNRTMEYLYYIKMVYLNAGRALMKENYSDSSVSYLGVDTKNGRLYDPEKGYLDISEALSTAIVKIGRDGFVCKDAVWDVIRFKDGRIQFDIENGAYALIYSLDGKPTYIHKPDEDNRIYVRGIEDRWYHVSKIS